VAVEEGLIEHYRDAATKMFDALVFDPMLDENVAVIGPPKGNPSMQPYSSGNFMNGITGYME
jgi:hypothetical protein